MKQGFEITSEYSSGGRQIISVRDSARTLAAGLEYSALDFLILRKIGIFDDIIAFKAARCAAIFGYGEECCASLLSHVIFNGPKALNPQLFEEGKNNVRIYYCC